MKNAFKMKCETQRQLRQTMNKYYNENYHTAKHVHEPALIPMILNKVIKTQNTDRSRATTYISQKPPQCLPSINTGELSLFTFGWQVFARSHQLILVGTRKSSTHSYQRWRIQFHALHIGVAMDKKKTGVASSLSLAGDASLSDSIPPPPPHIHNISKEPLEGSTLWLFEPFGDFRSISYFVLFVLFESRSFRSVRTITGPGGVIVLLPSPK